MDRNNRSTNPSIFVFLTVLFTVLKLSGAIDWSWFWVLFPLILPVSIVLVAIVINLLFIKER